MYKTIEGFNLPFIVKFDYSKTKNLYDQSDKTMKTN